MKTAEFLARVLVQTCKRNCTDCTCCIVNFSVRYLSQCAFPLHACFGMEDALVEMHIPYHTRSSVFYSKTHTHSDAPKSTNLIIFISVNFRLTLYFYVTYLRTVCFPLKYLFYHKIHSLVNTMAVKSQSKCRLLEISQESCQNSEC